MNRKMISIAVVGGVGLLAIGAATFWKLQQECTQVRASGGQEVTFSRGCINPQRYRRWTVTASLETGTETGTKWGQMYSSHGLIG
ncbi:MAG TPA: hypothetical protein V6D18_11655 [Thermosynechococcaceae cyanobacterium]